MNHAERYPVTITEEDANELAELKQKQSQLYSQIEKEWGFALGEFITDNWNSVVKVFSSHEHCNIALLESSLEQGLLGEVITKKELLDMEKPCCVIRRKSMGYFI